MRNLTNHPIILGDNGPDWDDEPDVDPDEYDDFDCSDSDGEEGTL